ncbi:MAG: cation-transporting P-type ATPase, partial [Tepidiformaceae bacterium]
MAGTSADREWHRLEAANVAALLEVDPERGLSATTAASRLEQYGSNRLTEAAKEPGWRAFLRQYRDLMQIVLVVAAVINQ